LKINIFEDKYILKINIFWKIIIFIDNNLENKYILKIIILKINILDEKYILDIDNLIMMNK